MKSIIGKSGCEISLSWAESIPETIRLDESFPIVILSDGSLYPAESDDIPYLTDSSGIGIAFKTSIRFQGSVARITLPHIPLCNIKRLLQQVISSIKTVANQLESAIGGDVTLAPIELENTQPSLSELREKPYTVVHPILSNDVIISSPTGKIDWFDSRSNATARMRHSSTDGNVQSTVSASTHDEAQELDSLLKWELESQTSAEINRLENPFHLSKRETTNSTPPSIPDELISTESLSPWMYKYGSVAPTLWEHLSVELLYNPSVDTHPVFAPDEKLYDFVTSTNKLSRIQYVKMCYDLFRLLRFEVPVIESDWYKTAIMESYKSLGHNDIRLDSSRRGPTWESMLLDTELIQIAQELHEKNRHIETEFPNGFTYPVVSYSDLLSYKSTAFSYTQSDTATFIRPDTHICVPDELSRSCPNATQATGDVIFRLNNYGYIPPYVTMRESVLPGTRTQSTGVLLPRAIWGSPKIAVLRNSHTNTAEISDLQAIVEQYSDAGRHTKPQTWSPMTKEQIEDATPIEEISASPFPRNDVNQLLSITIADIRNHTNGRVEPLSYWIDKMEEFDTFQNPQDVYYPYDPTISSEDGWQTGITVSDCPIHHLSEIDESPMTDENMYIRGAINKINTDGYTDEQSWGVRPAWEHVLPAGKSELQQMSTSDEAIKRIEEESNLEPDTDIGLIQFPFPVVMPSQVTRSHEYQR